MAIRNIYAAENWLKVYEAFKQINFSSFDYDSIKQSLVDYIRIYHAEDFNDLIESSEFMVIIEGFCYIAEQLNYRLDMLSHENFLSTAQRKDSILKLAKLISYKPTRNIPARSLVKISTISTTESVIDSQGNQLSGQIIIWNDANNPLWKEQFFLVLNRVLTNQFGQYTNSKQIGDVEMQLYTFNNIPKTMKNGIYSFTVDTGLETFPMELVSINLDDNGPYEKTPDINSQMSFIYANDGLGDNSDYTGCLMYIKQGILNRLEYAMNNAVPNRILELALQNINDSDVWITQVDENGVIKSIWEQVETLMDQNITFNVNTNRKKFEVETLENDKIKILFGDGDFSEIPLGNFYIWVRQSMNRSLVVQPNKIQNQPFSFQYTSNIGTQESCKLTFSLISTIQNSSPSESIEHIRQSASAVHYSQNRMVNAQDYNMFMLKDPSILRLNAINRTFAGQPKYIDWNDASGNYQNIKLFGDDLTINQEIKINTINTNSSISSRNLLDNIIEPLLSSNNIINLLNHISATNESSKGVISFPRRQFLEDNRVVYKSGTSRTSIKEKTEIQGAIDQHYYGEPLSYTTINNITYALIKNPATYSEEDGLIWSNTIPRTVDGVNAYIPGDTGSGLQVKSWQEKFGLTYNRLISFCGTDVSISGQIIDRAVGDVQYVNGLYTYFYAPEVISIEVAADKQTLYVTSDLRGALGIGTIGKSFLSSNLDSPIDFTITQSSSAEYELEHGDCIKIELPSFAKHKWDDALELNEDQFKFSSIAIDTSLEIANQNWVNFKFINLLGRWEIINGIDLPSDPNILPFDPNLYLENGKRNPNSWIIWVKAELNPVTQQPSNFIVNFRELSLIIESKNTKFWYNSSDQIIDSQTKNRVYDQIRILRSNLRPDGKPVGYKGLQSGTGKFLGNNEIYDVIDSVKDSNGVINTNQLEVMPSDALNLSTSGDSIPDKLLQFYNFVDASNNESAFYVYFIYDDYGQPKNNLLYDTPPLSLMFSNGSMVSSNADANGQYWGRKLVRDGLDFMWLHYSPYTNLIDPSVSNIHDMYIMTKGYFDNMSNYIKGMLGSFPVPPTPLELRNQYGYLLNNKMLSDTTVLHPGKFKLLFGPLAEPQLRGRFKVVQSATATLSIENLKIEILNVINTYFNIQNWDFAQTLYITELCSLIHQRLPTEVASVVLVPLYSVNSFGSLFVIDSGLDEILMSCAQLEDIEIVSELSASILRQGKI
jgi:hypothetical protein